MTIQPPISLSNISANGNSQKLPNLLTEIFKQLKNNDTEEKVLQTTVEIVYQTLKCDRVVVYSMEAEAMCKITAEAVTPGYAQILNRTFKDVCFEAGYVEKYQKGRVRAIADVDNSSMTACHLETLKDIDVRANLVVPLINRDTSLYGLLVMHQCSRSRQWQQTEVEFVLEIADWTMKQIDQQRTNLKIATQLANHEKARQIIGEITKEIHGVNTLTEVLQLGVDRAREILNCDRVIVYGLQNQSMGEVVAEATMPALASILGNIIKDPCFEYRYIDKYEQGRISSIPNIYEAGMTACYVENLAKIGVRSNLVAPIIWDDGKIYGLLVAHQCFNFKEWQPGEISNFQEIALHVGLSLSKAKLKEQSQFLENGVDRLDNLDNKINLALTKLQQLKQPIMQTNQTLIEANNIHKLLEREINLINKNSSAQTQKDTKLIQIMIKKLGFISGKLKQYLYTINTNRNEVGAILNESTASKNKS